MPILEQTQAAMSELAGNRQLNHGSHLSLAARSNLPGINLGEVPFDAATHEFAEINPFSIAEQATGLPHVQMVLPRRALSIQIVEDITPSGDDPRIVKLKQGFVETLEESITESKPGMTDRVRHYLITDAESEEAQKRKNWKMMPLISIIKFPRPSKKKHRSKACTMI